MSSMLTEAELKAIEEQIEDDAWIESIRVEDLLKEVRRLQALEAVSQVPDYAETGLLAVGNELTRLRKENARLRSELQATKERWNDQAKDYIRNTLGIATLERENRALVERMAKGDDK